jgi:cytochrome d ubiquinol oxidase subunit II
VFSSLTLACIILTAGIAMFPFIMPSSTMMNASLTMWDATSSQLTLNLMTYVACLRTDYSGLHHLVLLENVRSHHERRHRKQHPLSVLSKELNMWYFAWILGRFLPVHLGSSPRWRLSTWKRPKRVKKNTDEYYRDFTR